VSGRAAGAPIAKDHPDYVAIAGMRAQVKRHARAQNMERAKVGLSLRAVQGTQEAEMYLRHLGRWAELLGIAEVRVNIA